MTRLTIAPRDGAADADEQPIEPVVEATATRRKIMVIDDHRSVLEALTGLLGVLGHECVSATSGSEGIALLDSHLDVGMVMMDLSMPGLSGLELLDRLRERAPAVPVVLCSGLADDRTVQEALAGGAADFLKKPFGRNELMEVIDRTAR